MNHSASRALALLQALNQRPVSAVGELARETGISKPSVVRLLAILMEEGYVQRASKAGSYTLAAGVLRLSAGYQGDTALCRAAGPRMEALTEKLKWPAALGFFERGEMVVRYSTIPSSPLSWYRTTLYHKLPLLTSGMGQVFLAYSQPSIREALLAGPRASSGTKDDYSEERYERIRVRGYALRLPTPEHPTLSISVPVMVRGRVGAALSLTLFGRVMRSQDAVAQYLGELQETAKVIPHDSELA